VLWEECLVSFPNLLLFLDLLVVLFSQKESHTTHTSLPVYVVYCCCRIFSVFTGARMETN